MLKNIFKKENMLKEDKILDEKKIDEAVQTLKDDIKKALLAESCIVFTTRLVKKENGEDELNHTMFYGAGFKYDDMYSSLEAYKELIDKESSEKPKISRVQTKMAQVVDVAPNEEKKAGEA